MSEQRRVAFVGGIDRIEQQIVSFGDRVGVEVEVHTGRTGGSRTARLAAIVRGSQLVVVVTGTNSHNAVHIVKREASRAGVPVRILTFCGAASARALLEDFAAESKIAVA